MDLDIEVIPDENNLIESASIVLKELVQQLGVPSGMQGGKVCQWVCHTYGVLFLGVHLRVPFCC